MLNTKNQSDLNSLNQLNSNNKFKRNLLYVSLFNALLAISLPVSVQATTVLGSSTSNSTLTDDTDYLIESGTILDSVGGNGIETDATLVINGQADFTLTNNGTINSTKGTESGVRINQAGTLVNEATGSISGNRGVYASGSTGARDIVNRGDISSITSHGIYYNNANGTIDNYGTINGAESVQSSATGILITNGSTITLNNHAGGAIYSGDNGSSFGTAVYLQSGLGNVVNNDGLIKGTFGGVRTSGDAVVNLTNTGTIESIKRAGVELAGGNGNIIDLKAGSVSGTTGVLVQSNNNTIFNAATITGNSGTAIDLSGNNNNLVLQSGSDLVGDVVSTGTGNGLILQGSGSESANFVGNSASTGFSSVSMTGDSWTLSGDINLVGSTADTLAVDSGTLVLEGTATQANVNGGTYIASAGTLQLGNNTETGMVTGNIINNGTLIFNRSDDVLDYHSDIAGSGDLVKLNEGTLIFSGNNYSSGKTVIEAGTLQIGDGATKGSISGDIVNKSNLVFNRMDNIDYAGDISGVGQLTQDGSGTLTLSGTNTHTGGTTIAAGTLQLGNGGTTGSVTGNIANNGELVFDRSNDYAYAGVISGTGNVVQQGDGRVFLGQNQTYSGTTTVNSGALILTNNAQLTSTSPVTIAEDGMFGGHGSVKGDVINNGLLAIADAADELTRVAGGIFQIGGDLINSGEIRMAGAQHNSQLIVDGNYTGNDGTLTLNTYFAGTDSKSDKLVVQGNTSGTTNVFINASGGVAAPNYNGIEVVHVDGQSDGQFVLANRVAVGAYEYFLHQGQPGGANGNWYLLSELDYTAPGSGSGLGGGKSGPVYRPEAGNYAANMAAASTLFNVRLIDREGRAEGSSLWLRQAGGQTRFRDSSGQLHNTSNHYVVQGGGEVLATQFAANDRLGFGVMAGYGRASTHTNSQVSGYSSKGKVDGYNAGLYGTWYQDADTLNGLYVDSWVNYSWLTSTVNGEQLKGERSKINGYSASLESGYRLPVHQSENAQVSVTPQVQVTWNGLKAKDHTEVNGTNVKLGGNGNLQTRVGLKFSRDSISKQNEGNGKPFSVYAETNWLHNDKTASATMDGVTIKQANNSNIAELKLGVEGQVTKSLNLWSNVTQQMGSNSYSDTSVVIGAKYRF